MIDQNALPDRLEYTNVTSTPRLVEAIRSLTIRGAPALGAAGAYGVVLALNDCGGDVERFRSLTNSVRDARPTAVNLAWGVNRVLGAIQPLILAQKWDEATEAALAEAGRICEEDIAANRALSEAGAVLVRDGGIVITHCNTGDLATVSGGTALGVLFEAHEIGRRFRVFADETRPRLQGMRLTAWELARAGIEVSVMPDGAAAFLMASGGVQMAIVGADRIAANGDTANKIGTYSLAIAARRHNVPFYVAAPVTTIDPHCPTGADIPIELRGAAEVFGVGGFERVPDAVEAYNPAFDVTPAELISGIITDRGILSPEYRTSIEKACSRPATVSQSEG